MPLHTIRTLGAAALLATASAEASELPPAAEAPVDFTRDVRPILERSCVSCHAGGKRRGGLRLDTRALLVEGGESGPAAVAGDGAASLLVRLVAGLDPDRVMPAKGERLTESEIGVLRAWIDGGLAWPEGFSFAAETGSSIAPRHPALPDAAASGLENPVDRLLASYLVEHGVALGQPVPDGVYARRVFLDVIGLLPSPEEFERFERDASPDKRKALARELLGRRREYAEHWLSFWNDALRNAYRGTGFIDDGRKQITGWLFDALYSNAPYDRFVRELISPVEGSEGFVKGIIWRGTVNASQQKEMQAAQNVAQVFLGTNLKCASCHDSFVNDWTLADAYALASVFAAAPLELHRCNKPIGEHATPRAPFPELGAIDAAAPREARMRRLAELLTSRENGRLTRTVVNRLWAALFGRGLIEPVDEMERAPWHRDLLDWLAADLADHDFDLKRTIELIVTSRAYQMPSVGAPGPDGGDGVFRGPLVRRMSAEQFVDAVSSLTGEWAAASGELLKVDGRGQGGQLAAVQAVLATHATADAGAAAADGQAAPVRAAVAHDDALQRALGRPSREQVMTRRDSVATTLQALELSNGATLAGMLERGAATWLERTTETDALVEGVWRRALGRAPDAEERAVGAALVATPPTVTGVADLLWVVAMLPEFQLID